jgi:di/tricarboxylate transporter
MDRLTELQGRRHLVMEENDLAAQMLAGQEVGIVRVRLAPDSELAGKTLRESSFRRRWGLNVMALTRNGRLLEADLQDTPLRPGDVLLLHGRTTHLEALEQPRDWELAEFVSPAEVLANAGIRERLMSLSIPEDSVFSGRTLAESRLGDSFGLTVLSIGRQDGSLTAPDSDVHLQAGDRLLVRGAPGDLQTLRGLQQLEVEQRAPVDMDWLESEETGLMEAVLSPHTTLLGKTLRELHFREKYGLSVLAVWRQGRAYRSNLRDMALHLGDALLLYGPREKLQLLGAEPDFLVLTEAAQQPLRLSKAPLAVMVMAAVLLPVIAGWVPISIAAVAGATLMVLTGCLNMEEAYRNIEWKAVFLIAGMLPLGLAIEQTGAARWLVSGVLNLVGDLGPLVMVASVFVMTALAMQILPTQAAAVLMAPIALNLAADMNLSAHAVMMAVVLASGSFLSPYAHPANVLVMGPGGYRYVDYIKVGAPLVLLLLVVTLVVMPLFWPL